MVLARLIRRPFMKFLSSCAFHLIGEEPWLSPQPEVLRSCEFRSIPCPISRWGWRWGCHLDLERDQKLPIVQQFVDNPWSRNDEAHSYQLSRHELICCSQCYHPSQPRQKGDPRGRDDGSPTSPRTILFMVRAFWCFISRERRFPLGRSSRETCPGGHIFLKERHHDAKEP